MTELEAYYNKFNENKRLISRHGQVEFITSMKYIHDCIEQYKIEHGIEKPEDSFINSDRNSTIKILDIGAGTGRYSVQLAEEGYDVTAVELVQRNLDVLKSKRSTVKAHLGTALDLSAFPENNYDIALVFGPMYHLFEFEEKKKVLEEAKRVVKEGGMILVAYCMNEYCVMVYGFKEGNIKACLDDGRLDHNFHCATGPKDLYDYMRLEDIQKLDEAVPGLKRIKMIAADGPANYIRPILKDMDDETFEIFMQYHLSTCERPDLMGASAHTVDILKKIQGNDF